MRCGIHDGAELLPCRNRPLGLFVRRAYEASFDSIPEKPP